MFYRCRTRINKQNDLVVWGDYVVGKPIDMRWLIEDAAWGAIGGTGTLRPPAPCSLNPRL